MLWSPRTRRLAVLAGALVLVVSLAPASSAHHANPPGPVNAQTTFGWGKPKWQDDFIGPRKRIWRVSGRGNVRTQHGMLTLNTAKRGSTRAILTKKGHRTGRWEIRLRSRRYSTNATDYRVRTELVPARSRARNCGARNVALESYRLGSRRAHTYLRTRPNRSFNAFTGLNLSNDRWHTFAVEVTRKRISWFVDGHVLMSERRSAALSGVPFTVRFTMVGTPGRRMNQSRMQMDWLRYFTLAKPNKRSVRAPQARRTTYAGAC